MARHLLDDGTDWVGLNAACIPSLYASRFIRPNTFEMFCVLVTAVVTGGAVVTVENLEMSVAIEATPGRGVHLVVVAACGNADLVLGDFVDKTVLVGNPP